MTKEDAYKLQKELLAVFDKHNVDVGVGIINGHRPLEFGVGIRSQDGSVDAQNLGTVTAYE